MSERSGGRPGPKGGQRGRKSGGPPSGRSRGGQGGGRNQQRGGRGDDRPRDQNRGGRRGGHSNAGGSKSIEKPERHFGDSARGSAWGGVARRGAHNAHVAERGWGEDHARTDAPDHGSERWERETGPRGRRRGSQKRERPRLDLPEIEEAHLRGLNGDQRMRLRQRLREAGEAYLGDRFGDAEKILGPLAKRHPQIPEILELYGLTLYRLGRWKPALSSLELLVELTGDLDQLPVMADCYRALGRHGDVRRLWDELRHSGPSAPIMVEGRIVMAGSLVDQEDLAGAIRLLEKGPVRPSNAKDHHVRLWYALADVYERAGEHQRARRGFERIEQVSPGYLDVPERLDALD